MILNDVDELKYDAPSNIVIGYYILTKYLPSQDLSSQHPSMITHKHMDPPKIHHFNNEYLS